MASDKKVKSDEKVDDSVALKKHVESVHTSLDCEHCDEKIKEKHARWAL